jgi:Uri superfamily endonuclease
MNLRLISSQRQRDCKRVPENLGPGTYILVLCLPNLTCVQVGKLGDLKFLAGFYLYIGSALGRGGVSGRLKHHWDPGAVLHWHIDYLLREACLVEIWYQEGETRQEHRWADLIHEQGGLSTAGFGSSDCSCASHLFYFKRRPRIETIGKVLRPSSLNSSPIRKVQVSRTIVVKV